MCNYIQYIYSRCSHAATPVFVYQLCSDNCALRREEFYTFRFENHVQYPVSEEPEVEKVKIFSRCRMCQRNCGLIHNPYDDDLFMIIDDYHRRLAQHLTWIMPTVNVAKPRLFREVSYDRSAKRELDTLAEQDEGEISPKTIPARKFQREAEPLIEPSQPLIRFQLTELNRSAKVDHLTGLNAQLPRLYTENVNRILLPSPSSFNLDSARSSEKFQLPHLGELSAVNAPSDLVPQTLRLPGSYERTRVVRVDPFADDRLSRSSISSQEIDDSNFGFGAYPTRTAWEEIQSPPPVRRRPLPRLTPLIIPPFGRSLRNSEIANYTLQPGPLESPITISSTGPTPKSPLNVSPSPLVLPSPALPLTELIPLSSVSPSLAVPPLRLTRRALPSPPKSIRKVSSKPSTNSSLVSPVSSSQPYPASSPSALTPLSYISPSLVEAPLVIKKKKPLPTPPATPPRPSTSSEKSSYETLPSSPRAESLASPSPSSIEAQPTCSPAHSKSPDRPARTVPQNDCPATNSTHLHATRKAQDSVKNFLASVPSRILTPLSSNASPSLMPSPLFSRRPRPPRDVADSQTSSDAEISRQPEA